jgi:ABC-type nitrate/sulfonate/bicarbonate transport system substrate-binding protein
MMKNDCMSRLVGRLVLTMLLPAVFIAPALGAEALRIAVSKTPLSLPFYVAENQGYISAEKLAIEFHEVIGGHRAFQQVAEGSADLATSSDTVVMFNSFLRRDFAIIATFVTSDDDTKIVVRPDAGISRPSQLAGKRIARVPGTSAHYALDATLIANGIDPKDTLSVNIQPEAMADALRRGKVDAVATWEPFPFQILNTLQGSTLLSKSAAYVTTFNLVAHRNLIAKRDDDLVRLLRALNRAQRFIALQPAQAQAILRERLGLEQAFIDWIWPRYNYRLSLEQGLIKTLESEARWARREGQVKSESLPNYLDFIHSAPLRSIQASAVSIVE